MTDTVATPAPIDPVDVKRLKAQLGTGKASEASFFVSKRGETEVFTNDTIKNTATIYFSDCHDCEFVIDALCTKLIIDKCSGVRFSLNAKIVTNIVEMYKCNNCVVEANVPVKTLQADGCHTLNVNFARKEDFDRCVWAGTRALTLRFVDAEHEMTTGYDDMLVTYKGLREDIDQFICRFGTRDVCEVERVVRLDNGFPTTFRERLEFEERQERNMRELAKQVYGEDIVIPKKARVGPKIKPNDPCPCTSGKKFKKCCQMRAPGAAAGELAPRVE